MPGIKIDFDKVTIQDAGIIYDAFDVSFICHDGKLTGIYLDD